MAWRGGKPRYCMDLAGYGSVAALAGSVGEELRGTGVTSPKAKPLPAELLRINAQSPEADVLRYAADFLARGSVVAIPTDTFYGLAADPFYFWGGRRGL